MLNISLDKINKKTSALQVKYLLRICIMSHVGEYRTITAVTLNKIFLQGFKFKMKQTDLNIGYLHQQTSITGVTSMH